MSGRHKHKNKKKHRDHLVAAIPVSHEAKCQEYPDYREEGNMNNPHHDTPSSPPNWIGRITIFLSVLALFAYFTQACYMRQAMRVDQRAWVSMPFPKSFDLNGQTIPVIAQIADTGKTPAKGLVVDVIASVFNKDDEPAIGDFTVGHPHLRLHAPGIIFPRDPVPVNILVGTYLPKGGVQPTVPDDALRQDIAQGRKYILFFGSATYSDVFTVEHYTRFCTGQGDGIPSKVLTDCLKYNDVDSNQE